MDLHDTALNEDYEALIQFMYLAPVGLAQLWIDGRIALANPLSAQLLMPLSRNGDLDNLFEVLETVAPDLRHRVAQFPGPHGMVCDALPLQIRATDGRVGETQVLSLTVLKLDDSRLMAVLSDITLQVRRERLLRQSEAWMNAVMTGISDYALVRLDARGCVDSWNASVGRVTGHASEAVVGQPYSMFSPEDASTPERLFDRLREADQNGWSLEEGWRQRADGSRFWGSAMIVPMRVTAPEQPPASAQPRALDGASDLPAGLLLDASASSESSYCLVIRDITDSRQACEDHRLATQSDHLTGLANRRAFFEAAELELHRWCQAPRPLSLVMFDADHFKHINDNHEHPAGDAVLRHLASLLAATFRQVDVVGRIGREEFAVLLPCTDLDGAQAVANRLRVALAEQPLWVDGVAIPCTVSGGVATMSARITSVDDLIKQADAALYAAKANGRNRIELGCTTA